MRLRKQYKVFSTIPRQPRRIPQQISFLLVVTLQEAASCPLGGEKEEIYIGIDEDHKWKTTVSLADANKISLDGVCYHN